VLAADRSPSGRRRPGHGRAADVGRSGRVPACHCGRLAQTGRDAGNQDSIAKVGPVANRELVVLGTRACPRCWRARSACWGTDHIMFSFRGYGDYPDLFALSGLTLAIIAAVPACLWYARRRRKADEAPHGAPVSFRC
jgi:hypothetical protein